MSEFRTCTVCNCSKLLDNQNFKWRRENNKYRPECRSCHNRIAAARRYGLTLEQYIDLEEQCGGNCQICNEHVDDIDHATFRRLVIDHDHLTGKVRGMLCARCNAGIGQFDDDPAKLIAAAEYLSHYRTSQ